MRRKSEPNFSTTTNNTTAVVVVTYLQVVTGLQLHHHCLQLSDPSHTVRTHQPDIIVKIHTSYSDTELLINIIVTVEEMILKHDPYPAEM